MNGRRDEGEEVNNRQLLGHRERGEAVPTEERKQYNERKHMLEREEKTESRCWRQVEMEHCSPLKQLTVIHATHLKQKLLLLHS